MGITVQGEREATFTEIVQHLVEGRDLEGCAGCALRLANDSIIQNPPQPLASVDATPQSYRPGYAKPRALVQRHGMDGLCGGWPVVRGIGDHFTIMKKRSA